MHDLQTIIKLNRGPLNATSAAAEASIKAHQIAMTASSHPVPAVDWVSYEIQCPVCGKEPTP